MPLPNPRLSSTVTALALLAAAAFAHAASTLNEGVERYAGATLGAVELKPEHPQLDKRREVSGPPTGGLFIGSRVARLPVGDGWPVHLELGLQNIARHTVSYGTAGGSSDLTASGYAASLSGRLSAPLTRAFGVYGRLGVSHASVKGGMVPGQPAIAVNGSATGLVLGYGIEVQFAGGPVLRTELARYSKTSARSSATALVVGFSFGL